MAPAVLLCLCAMLAAGDADDVAYEAHLGELAKRYALSGFHHERCGAFVIHSDDGDVARRQRHAETVTWFATAMRRMYFERDPEGLTDIWLFKDKNSYETTGAAFFGRGPDSPYGYFSLRHGLVMNIATGGGTLCHELVHAYMRANFPKCPDWLNEGLASLYEQCGQRGDLATGLLNWRLKGLQEAIAKRSLPTFEALCATDFYGADSGRNYAQARYLCLHLQDTGKLGQLMQESMRDQATDPTAWKTLVRVVGEPDPVAWQRQWEQWVMGLKAPR